MMDISDWPKQIRDRYVHAPDGVPTDDVSKVAEEIAWFIEQAVAQRGSLWTKKGDPLCEADDESGEQPCVEKSHALERASRIATDTPTDDGAGGDMLSETIQRAKDNTLNRDAREAAVKAAHFQYFMNKAPFEEAVKTALRTADVLLPAEPAVPTVPEAVRRLPEKLRERAIAGCPAEYADRGMAKRWALSEARDRTRRRAWLYTADELDRTLAQHSEPSGSE